MGEALNCGNNRKGSKCRGVSRDLRLLGFNSQRCSVLTVQRDFFALRLRYPKVEVRWGMQGISAIVVGAVGGEKMGKSWRGGGGRAAVSTLLSILQLFYGFHDCFKAIFDGVHLLVDVGCIDHCHAHHRASGRREAAGQHCQGQSCRNHGLRCLIFVFDILCYESHGILSVSVWTSCSFRRCRGGSAAGVGSCRWSGY